MVADIRSLTARITQFSSEGSEGRMWTLVSPTICFLRSLKPQNSEAFCYSSLRVPEASESLLNHCFILASAWWVALLVYMFC